MIAAQGNQLRRQRAIIGGVCGGLAQFYGLRPFWFRLVFVVLALPGGLPGVIPYVILWLIIPKR